MDESALLHTSRREHALYRELTAVYHAMASALRDERAPVDPEWLAAAHGRAEAATGALRETAAALASWRLTGTSVPEDVSTLWRASAGMAADAAALNAELVQLARTRQAAVLERLRAAGQGRRALAGYRPRGSGEAALTAQRV